MSLYISKQASKVMANVFIIDKISTLGNQKKVAMNPTNVFWGKNWHKIVIFQFFLN
jgi:hypothetical protein